MSKTFRQFGVGMTVNDPEDLPNGMDDDAVVNDLREAVERAVNDWWYERGQDLVACEPVVG